jgi:hypothetical protein
MAKGSSSSSGTGMRTRDVRCGSRTAVTSRLVAQPVYPQLRKYYVHSLTYVSCQLRHARVLGPLIFDAGATNCQR